MVDVSEEKLEAAAQATYRMDYAGAMRLATGLNLDPNGICRALYGKELNACGTELLADGALGSPGLLMSHALVLDGTSGCWCTTPDAVALDIIGDIDLRVELQAWPGTGIDATYLGKWNATGNQQSYKLFNVFGLVSIHWSSTGADDLNDEQVAAPTGATALRATLDVVDGANHTSKAFSGTTLGLGTEYATETVVGNTSIFASTAVLGIGAESGGTARMFRGRITRAQVRSGLDGAIVANPDFRNLATGTTSFVDSAGLTWTVQGTARIA